MRIKHYILVLCLLFIATNYSAATNTNNRSIRIIVDNNIVAPETVSPLNRTYGNPPPVSAPEYMQASARRGLSYGGSVYQGPILANTISKVKPSVCPVPAVPMEVPQKCILPQRACGQWELSVQAYFARPRGRVSWPYHPTLDFNDDLGLDSHKTLFEYSARYQFRPRWALIYSIMPIEMEAHYRHPLFPGMVFHSKWDTIYQRVGLLFDAVRSCSGAISLYNAWVFSPQKLTMFSGNHCQFGSTTIDRTRNMVMSGIEIQRCITTKCNGGSLSCDTRAGIAYLDGTLGLDVQAGLRYSIPLNCGRWGYAKGGYRLIDFKEDRIDHRIDTYLTGWFVEAGLVF